MTLEGRFSHGGNVKTFVAAFAVCFMNIWAISKPGMVLQTCLPLRFWRKAHDFLGYLTPLLLLSISLRFGKFAVFPECFRFRSVISLRFRILQIVSTFPVMKKNDVKTNFVCQNFDNKPKIDLKCSHYVVISCAIRNMCSFCA